MYCRDLDRHVDPHECETWWFCPDGSREEVTIDYDQMAEAMARYAGYDSLGPGPEYWLGMARAGFDAAFKSAGFTTTFASEKVYEQIRSVMGQDDDGTPNGKDYTEARYVTEWKLVQKNTNEST